MPGFLLHVGAMAMCSHGGTAQPTVPFPRVKVSGQPIVLQPGPYAIAGCPFLRPPPIPSPCVIGTWTSAAVRVKANGMPVVLRDSQSTCAPNGTPLVITTTQVRVKGT